MVNTAANQEREMRVAVERVVGFAQEFGEAHLNLACHAAFPLSLTPDLLYQIWANFVPEAPWSAVARVLLSRLCKQVGSEMYEMDNAVRNLLLRELKVQFGQERFDSLGEFLLEYVSQRLTEDDPDTQDLRQAQEWTALAYTKPKQAGRELAQVLSDKVQQEDMGEVLRLSSLVETLSEPLVEAGFEPLLIYGQGMKSYFCGDLENAEKQFEKIQITNNKIGLAGINLNIPQVLLKEINFSWLNNLIQKFMRTKRSNFSKEIRIAVWGTTGAGKTTYLTSLYQALLNNSHWNISIDKNTKKSIVQNLNLINEFKFPHPTSSLLVNQLDFITYKVGLENPENHRQNKKTNINLIFIDFPGEFYEQNNLPIEIIDYFLNCHGILFLLDPISKKEMEKSYYTLLRDLFSAMKIRRQDYFPKLEENYPLEQFMAFAITKMDNEDVLQKYGGQSSIEAFLDLLKPNVTLEWLQKSFFIDKTEFLRQLNGGSYSRPSRSHRCQFFMTSSIGFYYNNGKWLSGVTNSKNQKDNIFNLDKHRVLTSESNQTQTQLKRIVAGHKLRPLNVFEPIEWLIEAIQNFKVSVIDPSDINSGD